MNYRILIFSFLSFALSIPPLVASTEGLSQEAYFKSTDIGSDYLGNAVAVSGRFAIVSAVLEDGSVTGVNPPHDDLAVNSGAAYVYERIDGVWTFHSCLKASNTDAGDSFGADIAIDGDLLAISAVGESSNATGINGDQANNDAMSSGAVYLFRLEGDTWVQEAYLKASNSDTNDDFGTALALDGETLVVGAPGDEGSHAETGSAYVFVRSAGVWTEQARLNAIDYRNRDEFGSSVAIDGDTLVVGAPREDGSAIGVNGEKNNDANNSGAAYVFTRSGGIWSEIAYLKASNTDAEDGFGGAVSISGNTIAVGAVNERGSVGGINPVSNNDILRTGAVYLFVDNGAGREPQATIKAAVPTLNDEFGNKVELSGDLLVVAFHKESGASAGLDGDQTTDGLAESGAVYLFSREGSIWKQDRYLKASNSGSGDTFGCAIAIHSEDAGDLLVIGASNEDGSSPGVNGANNNDFGNAGAAYAFSIPRPVIWVTLGSSAMQSNASKVNFGTARIRKQGRKKTFTIGSMGWSDLGSIRVATTGNHRRDFRVSQPAAKTLSPGPSTAFRVSFRPRSKGVRKTNLQITSNALKSNPFVVSLKGKGREP